MVWVALTFLRRQVAIEGELLSGKRALPFSIKTTSPSVNGHSIEMMFTPLWHLPEREGVLCG